MRQRMERRILIWIILYLLLGFLFYYLAVAAYHLTIWHGDELLYQFIHWADIRKDAIGLLYIGAGCCIIIFYYWRKTFSYLQEVVSATEQFYQNDTALIQLSEPLKEVENKMNQAKVNILNTERSAREAEQRKNDLVTYLAHDLKTPITSVIGYLTLLLDEPQISDELRAKYTGIVLNKAERLEELINEFFEITRFNLSKLTLEVERINLSRMLEQIASEFYPVLSEKQLRWHTEITPDIEILCDPDKLERVFDNLIRNAINYSYEDTDIFLSMKQTDDRVEIFVCNKGKTIPPEKLERIFEQFFRLDSARSSKTGGSGLGLAISKEIVELHGGSLKAESADESISFTVVLPLDCKKIV
ncbi:MAG: HAMP domain-containing histidine kinase [Lachnospiraceae bacterium]|nr:HAMP domain-containing histidine kinase [Lachnospiraceae bacterium]